MAVPVAAAFPAPRDDSTQGLTVLFRGVRGSYPMPGPSTIRFGGNTPCLEVRAGGHLIIVDAGTGIIGLGSELVKQFFARPAETRGRLQLTILLSHMHHDHIQGYPFFAPLYLAQTRAFVFGPRMLREDLAAALSGAMVAPYFPVDAESLAAERHIRNIAESDAVVFEPVERSHDPRVVKAQGLRADPTEVTVTCYHNLNHPRGGTFCYRIEHGGKALVYASDIEGYIGGDRRLIQFAQGADVLIHDAQYRADEYTEGLKQGWGHSTPEMAVEIARAAHVRRLVLFHHAPTNDDGAVASIERDAQAAFPATTAAYEGLGIEL
jgi:phosphoribosyl 1,2-cyclic phosphodiesterase